MITGLWSAASGMAAGSLLLDAIGVDLANVNTPGYKRNRVDLAEVAEEAQYRAGRTAASGPAGPAAVSPADWVRAAYGVQAAAVVRDFTQGTVLATGQPLDLALDGPGFFAVEGPDGTAGYTRAGAFRADAAGHVVDAAGRFLLSATGSRLTLPSGWQEVAVAADGRITATVVDSSGARRAVDVGQVGVAFTNAPETLVPAGGVFAAPDGPGRPQLGAPGQGGRGLVRQGALEQSNVDLAGAMAELILAQEAYTLSARAFSVADGLWQEANALSG